jgi:CYTH domain-containing protein
VTQEIERRFLIDAPPPDLPPGTPVRQGYVALDGEVSVRVRDAGGGRMLTVKGGTGRERVEVEHEIAEDEFEALWALGEGRRVVKRRSVIPYGDVRIEVDVFEDALEGLVIAEVEFPSSAAADAFEPPEWFGEEVTGRPEWGNPSLATRGRPDAA